jgi:hypothetical protein
VGGLVVVGTDFLADTLVEGCPVKQPGKDLSHDLYAITEAINVLPIPINAAMTAVSIILLE